MTIFELEEQLEKVKASFASGKLRKDYAIAELLYLLESVIIYLKWQVFSGK